MKYFCFKLLFLGLFFLCLSSCATYQSKVQLSRALIQDGRFKDALTNLKPLADQPSNDQLIYMLDYATALQIAGEYAESNKYFHLADKFAEIQDYASISLESGSFLFGEEMVQYKGEDFELILINAMSAINYLNLGDLENALVEVRRLNEKLKKYRIEAKRKFTENALALYLSGIIYEATRNWDDAVIAYEEAYQVAPYYEPLWEDLVRSNLRAKRTEAYKKWKSQFPQVVEKSWWRDSNLGEIVIIYQNGWGPRKDFRPDNMRYPMMYPIWSSQSNLNIEVVSKSSGNSLSDLTIKGENELFSVDKIAVSSLNDQYASLIARRIGGVIVKEVVAERIRKENQLLGDIALIAMYASDRADLRQWSTLPKAFRIYRISTPPGEYLLKINGEIKQSPVQVRSGGKVFVTERTFN